MATVGQIRTHEQYTSRRWQQYGIITYGETNDFPQLLHEIITASKTGNACLDIYKDFIYGMGFTQPEIGKMRVNRKYNLSRLKRFIEADLCEYNGVAIHINYNENFMVRSVSHVPFETVRLCTPTGDRYEVKQVAIHPDWGHRDKTRTKWTPSEIEKIDIFNPTPDIIANQVEAAGGWEEYKGQVFYYSGSHDGDIGYPIPKYIAEVTDMRTEDGLANVTGRNVCSNFMLAGILVDIMEGGDQHEAQVKEKQEELARFQGDDNSLQLWYMTAKNKDEVPVFVPFTGNNYDKAFTVTQEQVPDNIGQAFKQPPVLRAKDVNLGLGADVMSNAYKFYNSVTVRERGIIEEILETIFEYWWAVLDNPDFSTQPLSYNAGASLYERIGSDAMKMVMETINNPGITLEQRRNILKYGFGVSDDETLKLLPNDTEPTGLTEGTHNSGEPE